MISAYSIAPLRYLYKNTVFGGIAHVWPFRPVAGCTTAVKSNLSGEFTVINEYLVRNPVSTFFFPVEGDSMEGAEIFDGDILVVDRSIKASHGHIVVAFVNGE